MNPLSFFNGNSIFTCCRENFLVCTNSSVRSRNKTTLLVTFTVNSPSVTRYIICCTVFTCTTIPFSKSYRTSVLLSKIINPHPKSKRCRYSKIIIRACCNIVPSIKRRSVKSNTSLPFFMNQHNVVVPTVNRRTFNRNITSFYILVSGSFTFITCFHH